MRPGFGMKRKIIIIAVILVVVSISIYIWASTAFIDEMAYRERAYVITNYDRNIINWEEARVYLVKLREEPCRTFRDLNARINRYLLFLNGGYAVKVEFRTYYDGVLGPLVLYINPFTKQLIGIAPRY
jgi:hypothetical protein